MGCAVWCRSSDPGSVMTKRGWAGCVLEGRFKREDTHVDLWLVHVDVWQKPTQYCKTIIFQIKINNFKNINKILKFRKGIYVCVCVCVYTYCKAATKHIITWMGCPSQDTCIRVPSSNPPQIPPARWQSPFSGGDGENRQLYKRMRNISIWSYERYPEYKGEKEGNNVEKNFYCK